MTKKQLRELIKSTVKEYMGKSGRGSGDSDGNNIASPRPFADDKDELENYTNKNVYGGDGKHYRNEPVLPNPNRTKMTKF